MDQIHQYYRYFYEHNIPVDMVSAEDTFAGYKVVAAPVLYMVKEGMKEALTAFVKQGGILILTYMSGIVDQSDNVYLGGYPGFLRELAGVSVEEIDALFPDQKNQMIFADGRKARCGLVCDIMHLEGAEALAVYGSDFYKDSPVVTRNTYGAGSTYYIGSDPSEEGIEMILDKVREEAGISGASGRKPDLRSSAGGMANRNTAS
ncbi:MAG: beta-galactosidase trimerization domain-containing protein [Lachnospiraceae bacterium]